ncbi:hypothetical protein IQ63_08175 [Streptomyces acidiscabies]|uniref:Uncharacterized protein n=1 Tax=Streptomyces acidiscabies TaxID=42234 RepID=A0A0L0KKG2_9ACTN|nr:hypothetical protein IQ63_08175 [Streptomyces acidiscabies]
MWNTPAADRVASLREQATRYEEPIADLPDLDLLNHAYESVLREQIDTRDRYMSLLTSLRKHDDAVRAASTSAFKDRADHYAQYAVRQHMRPFDELLYRVGQLPDRPGSQQMAGLRSSAERVAFQLKQEDRPEDLIDPEGARYTLRTLRHVVGVLDAREGLDAAEVLGLVKNALDTDASTGLFEVADRGTPVPAPSPTDPPFAGPGWSDLGGFWTYQPSNSNAHVKAYPVGEDWYLDLWSARGQLLAFGTGPATEVAALAPALTAQADTWAYDRSEYAWRRFADTAQVVRSAPPQPDTPGPAADKATPADARVRAATAISPNRPVGLPAASPALLSASTLPELSTTPHPSR